jgi:ATP:corrinoid adenosyltransferase
MYPPFVSPNTTSDAERKMFIAIKEQLPDEDWIGLHSLGLTGHGVKPWAEVDFVLIGPSGVFGLEVKGGQVSRREGMWLFTNRHNRTFSKKEGPFDQVGTATSVLRKHLYERLPHFRPSLVGYGVVTPDVPFEDRGPDVEPEVVYDLEDVDKPFKEYADRLGEYWVQRVTRQRGRSPQALNEAMRLAVLSELRPDFDLRPSIKQRIGIVTNELFSLTQEQYKVLDDLVDNERVLVRGGAGTGKTLLAVEEAIRQAALGRKVLLVCFNKQLARHLRAAVKDKGSITVHHLHGLMATLIRKAGMQADLPDAREEDLFKVFYPVVALDAITELELEAQYEVVIVDEAQDLLLDGYLDVVANLLNGGLHDGVWRVFLDPKQNIFEATDPAGLKRLLAERPAQHRLRRNCRNAAPIAIATSLLSGVDQDEECRVEGPEVAYFWYRDSAHAARLLEKQVGRLLSDGVKPQSIVILSHRQMQNSSMRDGFRDLSYPLIDASSEPERTGREIRFSTISSYKGLESDAVFVTDVDNLKDSGALAALYVGTSRPRAFLAVFLHESVREAYDERAEDLGRRLAEATATNGI